jgi:predicted CoA-binding protein
MGASYADPEIMTRLLGTPAVWAVVGLSQNKERAAYGVAAALRRLGHRVVPVHPRAETVAGEPGFRSLSDIPFAVDVVDMFVNSSRVGAAVDEAVEIGAKAVWLQLDVIDETAAARASAAGLDVVMDRCPAIEAWRVD